MPADFQRLMSRFPSGAFGDYFSVHSPVQGDEALGIFRQALVDDADVLASAQAHGVAQMPYGENPIPSKLIPWGAGDENTFYWKVGAPDDPDRWTVAFRDAFGEDWDEYGGTASEFMLAVLSGDFTSEILYYEPVPEERRFYVNDHA